MMYFIAVILFLVWIGGVNSQVLYGGFIHVFLVLALLLVVLKILDKKHPAVASDTSHLVSSPKQFNESNAVALVLLLVGLISMVLGVNEMNIAEPALNTSVLMFIAGIIGSSVGFLGLLRRKKN